MTYYVREFEVDPGSANRSKAVEDEFDRISAALGSLENDNTDSHDAILASLALKANIASPTFTGTVTVPAIADVATDDNQPATTAFVQDVLGASGSLLPPQPGHAGEFLKTDGTSASWAAVAALDWDSLGGLPTTLEGFGITNAQHAIEFLQDGQPKGYAWRINFKNLRVTTTADTLTVETPVYPHHLLLAQGII